jgi:hypothetical protein
MSDPAALQRVGQWWATLEPTTKSMFEQIFAEQPELAVRVLSGGTVAATEETASLEELFAVDVFAPPNTPSYMVQAQPVIDPAYPETGTPFTITYSVWNGGTDASADRNDDVRILDADRQVVAEQQLTGTALPAQASEGMEATFPDGLPADGHYVVEIWVNLDGAPVGAPANEHGIQLLAGDSFQVGAYDRLAGPAPADETFRDEAVALSSDALVLSGRSASDMLEPFKQFLARAQTLVAAGLADFPDWQGDEGPMLAERVNRMVTAAEYIDPDYVPDWPSDEADEAAINAQQAAMPFGRLPYNRDMFDTYMPPVVEAAEAILACYRR